MPRPTGRWRPGPSRRTRGTSRWVTPTPRRRWWRARAPTTAASAPATTTRAWWRRARRHHVRRPQLQRRHDGEHDAPPAERVRRQPQAAAVPRADEGHRPGHPRHRRQRLRPLLEPHRAVPAAARHRADRQPLPGGLRQHRRRRAAAGRRPDQGPRGRDDPRHPSSARPGPASWSSTTRGSRRPRAAARGCCRWPPATTAGRPGSTPASAPRCAAPPPRPASSTSTCSPPAPGTTSAPTTRGSTAARRSRAPRWPTTRWPSSSARWPTWCCRLVGEPTSP